MWQGNAGSTLYDVQGLINGQPEILRRCINECQHISVPLLMGN